MLEILLITFLIFLLVALVVLGAYYGLTASKETTRSEVKRRLEAIVLRRPDDEAMPSILKEDILSEIPLFNRVLYRMSLARRAETFLDQADVKMRVGVFFLILAVLFALGLLLGILFHRGILFGLALSIIFVAIPLIYLANKRKKRFDKFTQQFPDALDMIARSLRAGHSFTSAMQVVYQEMPDPVSKVFRIAYDEQNLGLSISESLDNMTTRINSLDLSFFVTAVNIQRETGGNLAEIFEKIGTTIRERFKILGQVKIYTAQGKLSGYILTAIPIFLAFAIWVISPDYIEVLYTTTIGMYLIAAAVVLQIIGFFVIRKIINIRI
jgi:tight adherence protein B